MHMTEVHVSCCKNRNFAWICQFLKNLEIRDAPTICEILIDCLQKRTNLRKNAKYAEPQENTYIVLFYPSQKP